MTMMLWMEGGSKEYRYEDKKKKEVVAWRCFEERTGRGIECEDHVGFEEGMGRGGDGLEDTVEARRKEDSDDVDSQLEPEICRGGSPYPTIDKVSASALLYPPHWAE
jgi:hypothetical protein